METFAYNDLFHASKPLQRFPTGWHYNQDTAIDIAKYSTTQTVSNTHVMLYGRSDSQRAIWNSQSYPNSDNGFGKHVVLSSSKCKSCI